MIEDLFFVSGIAVNIGILYTIYKVNKIYLIETVKKEENLLKEGEIGSPHNLHSSQSVGNFLKVEDKEEIVKERLRIIGKHNYGLFKGWMNYIPGLASKND